MKAGSLRLRLLLGAAVAIFTALLVAWIAMTWLFDRHVERAAAAEMTSDGVRLVAELVLSPGGAPSLEDPLHDPRFDLPSSGRYWQLTTDGGVARSRSLWDQNLPADGNIAGDAWSARRVDGPYAQPLFLVERLVRPDRNGPPVLVQVARGADELDVAQRAFARELAVFLLCLWCVLLVAAAVQVRLGLRPLARLRDALTRLQRDAAARIDAGGVPREILPLTEAINALADTREKDLQRARRRAADLAHSLKTPLAALSAQSRRARADGAEDAADGLDRAIAAVGAAVEAELARSRAAAIRDGQRDGGSDAADVAEQVVGVVERTEAGTRLVFEVEIPAGLRIGMQSDDLTELLGALVENAARFAHRRVRLAGARDATGDVSLSVEDDGPGLDIDAEQALARGGRLDEAAHAHHGLGLAIVRELVEASGGRLELESSELGGLCVRATWPRAGT